MIRYIKQGLVLWLGLTLLLISHVTAEEDSVNPNIRLQQQGQQLLLDAQAILPMTQMMESALMHGISLEYSLEASITDPSLAFWRNPIGQQKIRVRLSFDALKQTYLLTNLSLQRVTSDRDLARSLLSLGNLKDLPIVLNHPLETGKTYQISVIAKLERNALPNALRLASLFDEQWLSQSPTLHRYWTVP
jgi:hypothetical protein